MFSALQWDTLPTGNVEYLCNFILVNSFQVAYQFLIVVYCSFSLKVISMNKMIDSCASRSICYVKILTAIHSFLGSVSSKNRKNDGHLWQPKRQNVSEQVACLAISSLFSYNILKTC